MPTRTATLTRTRPALAALTLGALGIVFGDIGTSPLYTLKTVIDLAGRHPGPEVALGSLSLIVWTLILVTTIKYAAFAMRVDNDGEGGILALLSLLGIKRAQRPMIVMVGLFGAALIYGDGAITPAISVLSALEGLEIVSPSFARDTVPVAVAILVILFAVQSQGTARIGRAFGPVMALWFLALAALGIGGIVRDPAVLIALDPLYGARFLLSSGAAGFLVLGGVFLCVTGAEALYADMGHFGARPIRLAWSAIVLPSLVLNYAGQTALVLSAPPSEGNIFFRLCPTSLLVPLVVLSTIATIIASQAIITGAFSMTRQAARLGWLPRLGIKQTSATGYGQIYIGTVNWLLALATIGLVLAFRTSAHLASAYGIAVSATMLMTSVLLFIAMRDIWGWGTLRAGAVSSVFVIVDAAFFAANSVKIEEGGYVPILLALFVYALMQIWHIGTRAVAAAAKASSVPLETFLSDLARNRVPRVPGTAVFLTRTEADVPPIVTWYIAHAHALQERVMVISLATALVPFIAARERLAIAERAPGFWRLTARFGFMERPDLPAVLAAAHDAGCTADPAGVTYFVGRERAVPRANGNGLPRWFVAIYAFLQRNAAHATDIFRLPPDQVVELGREVSV